MGRYYSGDIDGKFWFAVQPSNSAERFGVTGYQPEFLEYRFGADNIQDVESEIKKIEDALGDQLQKFDEFFEKHTSYRDEMLAENGISVSKLGDYADLIFGRQILECLKEKGYCEFEAEL